MHSDMQNMVHVMSAQLCDDGHHAAKYDSHASGNSAHAGWMMSVLFMHSSCVWAMFKEHAIS